MTQLVKVALLASLSWAGCAEPAHGDPNQYLSFEDYDNGTREQKEPGIRSPDRPSDRDAGGAGDPRRGD
jgi:hypothetical protein